MNTFGNTRAGYKRAASAGVVIALTLMLLVPAGLAGNAKLLAFAQLAPTKQLTVRALTSDGKVLNMWTTIQSGSMVKTGFTTLAFSGNAGQTYAVAVSDYQNLAFDHWDNGSTSRTRSVSLSADTTITAYYKTSKTYSNLSISALGLDGAKLNLWTTITAGGSTMFAGYTPFAYFAANGQSYSVTVSDYSNKVFDHWSDGTTSRTKTISLNANTALTAYFKTATTTTSPANDKFGIAMIHPSTQSGSTWYSKWDNGVARSFGNSINDPSDAMFITSKNGGGMGDGSYRTSGDGILKISGQYPRMYVFDPNKDWHNVEITFYGERISDTNIAWAGLQAYARTNHGAIGDEEVNNCDTRGYGAQLTYPGDVLLEKETSHHADNGYAQTGDKTLWSSGMPKNTWIGYKFVVRDVDGGQHVRLELYRDMTNGANGGTWEKVLDFTDTGSNFGTTNAACKSGVNPGLPLTSSNDRPGSETGRPNVAIYFRSDGVGTDGLLYKKASIREIDPLP